MEGTFSLIVTAKSHFIGLVIVPNTPFASRHGYMQPTKLVSVRVVSLFR